MKIDRILYICSGNIYRSRYAEAYTNFLAQSRELPLSATSRGLTTDLVEIDTSPLVIARMKAKGIPASCTTAAKTALREEDLKAADIIVALKESEHRPLLELKFPEWAGRITYWDISDVGGLDPESAFSAIEQLVMELLDSLQ